MLPLVAVVIGLISLVILAAQLIAGAAVLSAITGVPRWIGAILGGVVMTSYFAAGGLLGTAWVNVLQLLVMLAGFVIALPFTLAHAGGFGGMLAPGVGPSFIDIGYSAGAGSGWTLLFLTGPAFIISPGLIQKAYGAKSEEALRSGVALNAAALMLFAFFPVLLGMTARKLIPGIADPNLVLPTLLVREVPSWLGAIALAALFSTAVDTCDGILFMLSTSLSQDIYRRHLRPAATDAELLRVARMIALAGGVIGVLLSIYLATVIGALRVFYSVLGVTLFVPILGGLASARARQREALAAIATGIGVLIVVGFGWLPRAPWLDPTLSGIVVSALVFGGLLMTRRQQIQ